MEQNETAERNEYNYFLTFRALQKWSCITEVINLLDTFMFKTV